MSGATDSVMRPENSVKASGYLTPDNVPEERICRSFSIPNDTAWLGLLMGALEPLLREEAWRQFGELTPEECAAEWLQIYFSWQTACEVLLQTPFWDTAEDVDDDAAPGSQTWYGSATISEAEGLVAFSDPEITFIENAFIWAFAGLMAFSGQPGAAIAYLTIAPKFVISFKTGDWGGIVRIFVDAVQVWQGSTYTVEPGVLNVPVIGDLDLSDHQIYIVNDGEEGEQMKIIRKELAPDEVAPTDTRWNPDCDCVQQTPDGGTTWVDVPGLDPRSAPGSALPPAPTENPRCDAAARMSAAVQAYIDAAISTLSVVQAANAILAIVLVFLPGAGTLVELIIAVAEALLAIGTTVIEAAFTETVYSDLTCLAYCYIGSDGQLTEENWASFQAACYDHFGEPTTVSDVLFYVFQTLGRNGFNNASVLRTETGDCSGCDLCGWCWRWGEDRALFSDNWTIYAPYGAIVDNGLDALQIDEDSWSLIALLEAFDAHVTSFTVTIYAEGTPTPGVDQAQWGHYDGSFHAAPGAIDLMPGTHDYAFTLDDDETSASQIYLNPNGGSMTNVRVLDFYLRGTGTRPFGTEDNCD